MWIIGTVVNGERRELSALVIENDAPPSLEQVRHAARELPNAERLLEYLDREAALTRESSQFVRSFDAIQRWSTGAEAEANDFASTRGRMVSLQDAENALAYFGTPPNQDHRRPDAVVWHDHSTVVIPIPAGDWELEIEYQPEQRDAVRFTRLMSLFSTPESKSEIIFDARSYHGQESAVRDHWRSMRARGQGFWTSLRGTADFVVGRILRRVAKEEPEPPDDLTFQGRLASMRRLFPALADACPDLGSLSIVQEHDDAMVFVHGTVSCALQSLKDLCPGTPPLPIYRYEHDTFHNVSTNGQELARLIQSHLKTKRLLLVGHSRGGLVGRVALGDLTKLKYPADVHLLTFGTPHEGTPLVNIAKGLVNLLFKIGSYSADSIPLMSPIVAGVSYVYNSPDLPPGIAVMQEKSQSLTLMNSVQWAGPNVRCWGGNFNPNTGPSGFGIDVEGFLAGALSGVDHDLVVPLRSALAFGRPEPALTCSHVRYFEQLEVRKAVFSELP